MKIIKHAYPIETEDVEVIIAEAKARFEKDGGNKEYWYAYLSGVLQSAYTNLKSKVEIIHNKSIEYDDKDIAPNRRIF